jgi:glycerol-3-phosphate dehydrogenase
VVASLAGLRVLPAGDGRPFARTRETIYDMDDPREPRTVTIYGGKLTSYRADAEKVLHRLAASLPTRRPLDDTAEMPLGQ